MICSENSASFKKIYSDKRAEKIQLSLQETEDGRQKGVRREKVNVKRSILKQINTFTYSWLTFHNREMHSPS